MTTYKRLEAWKKSMQLVKLIYLLTASFPREERFGLASQLKRAAVSVPANIAEGTGRQFKKETLQFLHIARGSLYETETLLNISLMIGITGDKEAGSISQLLDEVQKILNGLINHLERSSLK